ncbi:MarR family transcriptional regulator [Kitasatospora sp. NBC_00240]|uniref:MarR family transcriptional regulator n=1 Tax=Kitasatospora herbaricolor TaxID=68217 RepID=A0ABZ1WMQ2_9ACTN|nr:MULTISPECIES: MarR family transcriptional regulator [Kitasatospora]MCX5216163.1 MarR family transcriptional regulator [Kitasatospora sp. NBC_00240]
MLMVTDLFGILRRLELTPTATNILSVMVDKQNPGGVVPLTQQDIAEELQILPSVVSRSMTLLVERGLVLRKGYRYRLHPAIAGYNTELEMQAAMARAAREGVPPILIPDYQKAPPKAGPTRLRVAG